MSAIDPDPSLTDRFPVSSPLPAHSVVVTGLSRDVRRSRVMASVTVRQKWAHLTNPSIDQAERAMVLFPESAIFLDFSDADLFWTVVGSHTCPALTDDRQLVIYATDATDSEGRSAAARVRGRHVRLVA